MLVLPHASPSRHGQRRVGYLNLSEHKPRLERREHVVREQGRSLDHEEQREQFHRLVWPHAEAILRAAHYLVSDPDEADDLAQETLVKAFRSLSQFRGGTNVRAWLMTILRNARIDHQRSAVPPIEELDLETIESNTLNAGEDGAELNWSDPDELLEAFEDHHVIAALQELPNEIRWTLLLVDVERMDHVDAAAVLKVPVGTIKSRAFRGRAMLRNALLPVAKQLGLVPRNAAS